MGRIKIYVAGPFFTIKERSILDRVISFLKTEFKNSELFIPMEHFIPDGETMNNNEWAKAVYQMDISALEQADLVIACYLGHYSDTGTAFEIGYAIAKGIKTFLYIPDGVIDVSIMPIQACSIINKIDKNNLNQK